MRTEWFVVIEARGAWWIDKEGTEFGPFSSRESARHEAMAIARNLGTRERRPLIYAPDDEGKQVLVWEGARK